MILPLKTKIDAKHLRVFLSPLLSRSDANWKWLLAPKPEAIVQDYKTQVSQGENLEHSWELVSPTENLVFLAAGEPKSSQFETPMAVSV